MPSAGDWSSWDLCTLLMVGAGAWNGTITLRNSSAASWEVKHTHDPAIPLPDVFPREIKAYVHPEHTDFMAALFGRVAYRKPPRRPATGERRKTLQCIVTTNMTRCYRGMHRGCVRQFEWISDADRQKTDKKTTRSVIPFTENSGRCKLIFSDKRRSVVSREWLPG